MPVLFHVFTTTDSFPVPGVIDVAMMLRVWAAENACCNSVGLKAEGEKAEGEKALGLNADGENALGLKADGEKALGLKAEGENADGENALGLNADGENALGLNADGAYCALSLVRSAVVAGTSSFPNSTAMSLNTARS